MSCTLKQIAQILQLPAPQADRIIHYLSTDSRQITLGADTMFVALQSRHRNGHQFLQAAYRQGVRTFLVQAAAVVAPWDDAVFFTVPDTMAALQQLAAGWRGQYSIPVIGITGSNGKTIVKEWLYQLLGGGPEICRSPRSFNSQIGVPLSVWQLQRTHKLGIFEAGISTAGEMERLEKIIQPTLGIFTHLGAAHDEGFANRKQKLQEKWLLFRHCEAVICCTDDPTVAAQAAETDIPVISWGFGGTPAYLMAARSTTNRITEVQITHAGHAEIFQIPFTDKPSVENALHAIVTCLHLGSSAEQIRTQLLQLHPLQMRLQWVKGMYQSLLLNDSYSHDMHALELALAQLDQQAGTLSRIAVLSDLPAQAHAATYAQMARMLAERKVHLLVAVGPVLQRFTGLFEQAGITVHSFAHTNALLKAFDRRAIQHAAVLIKGARVFGFEQIVQAWQQQQHATMLEVNLAALQHNLNAYRAMVAPDTRLMVMLKAFGYGTTDAELGRWLEQQGVHYLTVAYTDEGVALRQAGIHGLPIMVMNPEPESFDALIQHHLEPELYAMDVLQAFLAYAEKEGLTAWPVHLKVDTGMHRLGLLQGEADAVANLLQASARLRVTSVFTHLVASENEAHDAFTYGQAEAFNTFCKVLEAHLPYPFLKHAANTAAIARHPQLHYDMVRLGIGLFGVSQTATNKPLLQPVSRLYTTVAQVKWVPAGASVGYGRHTILQRDSLIATVRIGYADGYRRQLGNGVGYMYLHGHKAPVAGNVCMDMTMLDVTDLPEVKPGDRVEVFGEHISISELARLCQTIPYEIMTGISQRVKRVLVDA